ncbi:MAG: amidohydrolase [Betaproteobacteria bacterium]|nr:amidohydrolase [Betaproteobacteria bacterium]
MTGRNLTIFLARRIHTMDPSLPEATAVAVADGRIVAVGDLDSMAPWREGRTVRIDDRFADRILLPGLIDNHIHPFLGALLMPMELIAPEPWRQPDGSVRPAARTPAEYRQALLAGAEARPDKDDWYITFGYQPALHGRLRRRELDALFPDRPVILWQRSFHETYLNTRATEKLGLSEELIDRHPQVDWPDAHFFETGNKLVLQKLMSHFLRPEWYHEGLRRTAALMHQGGITTAGDMLFGGISPDYEIDALEQVLERGRLPMRVVNVFDARGFGNRASRNPLGPPDRPIDFAAGLPAMEALRARASERIWYAKAVKLFADGAMFSQLMQMNPPGYIDGHHGEWLMSPEVLADGVRTFWNAGWTIHVHVNGDRGMDAVLAALEAAQAEKPRFDHRFHAHHVGFHAQAQTARLAALGAHASVNPYYIHALADDYSLFGLGAERASQITRCASMLREGMRVSFHSDFMMAPPEPLTLAWCAATRRTRSGKVVSPSECLTLDQALRGVTIDAAWTLRIEHEVGSIAAGKRADFAVLLDDPYELGVDRLNEVRIAGTVFQGEPHLLARPAASTLAASLAHAAPAPRPAPGRLRPITPDCCGFLDRCDLIRQWSAWLGAAFTAPART